jgi:hypothetical protein
MKQQVEVLRMGRQWPLKRPENWRCCFFNDIVIACACPELFGSPVIMLQCGVDYCLWVLRFQLRILSHHKDYAISCVRKLEKGACPLLQIENRMLSDARVSVSVSATQQECRALRRLFGFAPC